MTLLRETISILKSSGIKPRDRLGQNFMVDPEAIKTIVAHAELGEGDTVLEVGPGIGSLTAGLLGAAGKVVAVEKDPRLCALLRGRFGDDLELIEGDALKVGLPEIDKCVSNIPYNISSPLTFRLLERGFELGVLTYQLEFARRMIAEPGTKDYSRISVACHYYADVEIVGPLGPEAFYPRPEVSSAMVRIEPREPPFEVDEKAYFELVRGLFVHKKKTVKKALFHSLDTILGRSLDKDEKRRIIRRLDDPALERRVFQLEPREIAEMTGALHD